MTKFLKQLKKKEVFKSTNDLKKAAAKASGISDWRKIKIRKFPLRKNVKVI